MKPKTHFILNNKRELELMFKEFKDEFALHLPDLMNVFDKGVRTLQKNIHGVIQLDDELPPYSKRIDNPFGEPEKPKEEKKEVQNEPENKIDVDFSEVKPDRLEVIPNKGSRRERIDIIINTIGLEIERKKVDKLLKVFDLELENKDEVRIKQILDLRD